MAPGDDGLTRATLTSIATWVREPDPQLLTDALDLLGWRRDELDPALPPAIGFAGAKHLILAAARYERLERLTYPFDDLKALMLGADLTTIQLVWRESATRFRARDPFPVGGVVEDPATGAAAAALGAYLRERGEIVAPATFEIIQGVEMGRPSRIDGVDLARRGRRPGRGHRRGAVSPATELAALYSIAAITVAIVLVVLLHRLEPEFDPSWRMLSEYSLGRYGSLMRIAFVAAASAVMAVAAALRGVSGSTVPFLLVIVAIGPLGAAFVDTDPITTPPDQRSRQDTVHAALGSLFILGFPAASTIVGIRVSGEPTIGPILAWASLLAVGRPRAVHRRDDPLHAPRRDGGTQGQDRLAQPAEHARLPGLGRPGGDHRPPLTRRGLDLRTVPARRLDHPRRAGSR